MEQMVMFIQQPQPDGKIIMEILRHLTVALKDFIAH
jgi:hypothetical protein